MCICLWLLASLVSRPPYLLSLLSYFLLRTLTWLLSGKARTYSALVSNRALTSPWKFSRWSCEYVPAVWPTASAEDYREHLQYTRSAAGYSLIATTAIQAAQFSNRKMFIVPDGLIHFQLSTNGRSHPIVFPTLTAWGLKGECNDIFHGVCLPKVLVDMLVYPSIFFCWLFLSSFHYVINRILFLNSMYVIYITYIWYMNAYQKPINDFNSII